jgi:hypothetical protein
MVLKSIWQSLISESHLFLGIVFDIDFKYSNIKKVSSNNCGIFNFDYIPIDFCD